MSRAVPAIAFLLLGGGAIGAANESPTLTRRPVGQILPAAVGPIRELHFSKEFRYVGGQRFILRKTADAEQHFFVVPGKPGAVRRLYWIQFEKLLPGIGESYDYSRDEAVTVGGVTFRRNVRRWDAPPEPDSDRGAMCAFLAKRGYRLPDGAVRIRLVHVPDANRREELMIIYAEAPDRGKPELMGTDVQRRALEGLRVVSTSTPADPASSDNDRLLALHEEVMRAHRKSDIDLLLAAEEDDYVVANRGEITRPDRRARRERLGPYLRQTRFTTYRDKVPPVVRVSADGSLGWVIVQVEARGEQTTPSGTVEPIEFESAWIELYEKRNGRWFRVGNVSNFKPSAGANR
jgi:hypothetical protein